MISIICPIYNEEKYISQCIDSMLAQDIDKSEIELLFIDGMSKDNTRKIVSEYCSKYKFIHLLDNPDRIVPKAMNIGIEASRGDIIMRIDAHSKYDTNYVSTLSRFSKELDADNVGAICKTDVLNYTPTSIAIKEILGHPFGVGNSQFRIGVNKITRVDTVPFGCWPRKTFEQYGLYDERLVRNQDIELSKRILRGGGKIYLVPDTSCTYFARENIKALCKNNYQNGFWNIKTVYLTNEMNSLSLRHFIPLIFLLSLLLPIICSIFWWPFFLLSAMSFIMYSLVALLFSIQIHKKNNQASILNLYKIFLSLHLSYGYGSLKALVQLPFMKR